MLLLSTKAKWLAVLLIIVVLTGGCGLFKQAQKKLSPEKQEKQKPKIKIGVSMATTEGDGYVIIKKTMDKLKKKSNADIIWKDAKNDPMEQAVNIDEMVKQKVKAVILQPVDPKEGATLVEKLLKENIKVVALERLPQNTPVDGFITPDYQRAGELQAQAVAKQVKSGQVLLLAGDQDQQSAREMLGTFNEYMAKNATAQVVSIKPKGYLDTSTAKQVVETGLSRYPKPKAIVTQDPALTMALLETMKVTPPPEDPITVGIGADINASKALMLDKHDAEVDIRPDLLGMYALKAAVQLAGDGHLDYDQKVKNDESDVPVKVIPVRLIKKDSVYLLKEMWGKKLQQEVKKEEKKEEKPKEQGQSQGGQGGSSGEQGSGGSGGGEKGQQGKMTKLKITTKEGKTIEIEVPGDVQKIEAQAGGEQGKEQGKGQEQGQQKQ